MIVKEIVDLMDIARKEINMEYKGMKVCEMGNQLMKWTSEGTGKKYLMDRGVAEHISIDLNGKNGSLRIDLSKPVNKWEKYFDMVTNYGTAEHVQGGIYEAFLNIHNFTRVGGVMVHVGPPTGGCPWHSPYHYDIDFFEKLANANRYRLVLSEVRLQFGKVGEQRSLDRKTQTRLDRSLVCSVLLRVNDVPFITKEEFLALKGIEGLK
jgi:hypothetical protein